MKAVVHSRNDALRFIDRVCRELGPKWEPPQTVEIKRFKPPRSLPQNAVLHTHIRELSTHFGYSEDELKDWFKHMYGPQKRFSFDGTDKLIPKSTTEYTREEMSDLIMQVERVAAENGVILGHE